MYPVGALMEKGITLVGGQVHVQRYWKELCEKIRTGVIDPTVIVTHKIPLSKGPDAYATFDEKSDEVIKVLLDPWPAEE